MRTLSLTIGLFLLGLAEVIACHCSFLPEFKTRKDLSEYAFIASVRILKIDSVVNASKITGTLIHKVEFEILEQFKGDALKEMIIWGWNSSLSKTLGTSCDIDEEVGDIWLLFAYKDKKIQKLTTGACTRTYKQFDANGYDRDRRFDTNARTVARLREIFSKPVVNALKPGRNIEYFADGNKSVEEYYDENGKLTGERKLWFPNGLLEGIENYKNGVKEGIVLWYAPIGQLVTRKKFSNSHEVDTTTHWFVSDTSEFYLEDYASLHDISEDSARTLLSARQISYEYVYDNKGILMHSNEFSRDGTVRRESIYYPKEKKQLFRFFHPTGVISSEEYWLNNKPTGIYKEWDKEGRLIKSWEYDKGGNQIKDSIKFYKY